MQIEGYARIDAWTLRLFATGAHGWASENARDRLPILMLWIGLIGVGLLNGTSSLSACTPSLSHEMLVLSFFRVDTPCATTGDVLLLMYWVKSCPITASSDSEPLCGTSRPSNAMSFGPGAYAT